jgi:7,8-dihydropterin-6-yl-methyl-4-(beta-D-ribofuranosyl)aminobenzene 5'-phosphate synthase
MAQQYALPKGNRRLFVKRGGTYRRDSFAHELAMVVKEGPEWVVFTGCAHSGILNMVVTVTKQFPEVPIKAVFGGFHLIGLPVLNTMAGSKGQVRSIGEELLNYPIERVYTGHCTGPKAYRVLKEVMAERLESFPTGSEVVL